MVCKTQKKGLIKTDTFGERWLDHLHHFDTVKDLRLALKKFAERHNRSWLRERHGYKTPNQIRAEQKPLDTETEFKMAA